MRDSLQLLSAGQPVCSEAHFVSPWFLLRASRQHRDHFPPQDARAVAEAAREGTTTSMWSTRQSEVEGTAVSGLAHVPCTRVTSDDAMRMRFTASGSLNDTLDDDAAVAHGIALSSI